jgi:hypothetical protein
LCHFKPTGSVDMNMALARVACLISVLSGRRQLVRSMISSLMGGKRVVACSRVPCFLALRGEGGGICPPGVSIFVLLRPGAIGYIPSKTCFDDPTQVNCSNSDIYCKCA